MPLTADSLLLQTNLTGSITDIATDDGLWLTATANNVDSLVAVSFPTPANPPTTGADLQSFTVKYRVTVNANSVTFNAYLRENGTRINGGTAIDTWASTVTTEATQVVTWDSTLLGTSDGSLVEVEVEAIAVGGGPTARTAGEFQFLDWVNEPDDATVALTTLNTPAIIISEQLSDVNDALGVVGLNTPAITISSFPVTIEEGLIAIAVPNLPALVLSENVAEVSDNVQVDVSTDTLIVTTNVADVNEGIGIAVGNTEALNLTEIDTSIYIINNIDVDTDSIVATELDASVSHSLILDVLNTEAISLTEYAVAIARSVNILVPNLPSFSIVENPATIAITPIERAEVISQSLVLTEFATTIVANTDVVTIPPAVMNIVERKATVFYKETPYVSNELHKLAPSTIVTLYELDLTEIGDSTYYFHAGTNELLGNVVWAGNTYIAIPIAASGFDINSNGEIPRPRLTISNILGTLGALVRGLDDLIGGKVTRRRTFIKYLDAVNFADGNPIADPNVEMSPDIYFVDRKVSENSSFIEFELSSSWDVQGVKLPRRQIIQNMCYWSYRGAECGFAGGGVADAFDNPTTDPALDVCSKSLNGCTLRFGNNANLPFGGFPGAGLLDV